MVNVRSRRHDAGQSGGGSVTRLIALGGWLLAFLVLVACALLGIGAWLAANLGVKF